MEDKKESKDKSVIEKVYDDLKKMGRTFDKISKKPADDSDSFASHSIDNHSNDKNNVENATIKNSNSDAKIVNVPTNKSLYHNINSDFEKLSRDIVSKIGIDSEFATDSMLGQQPNIKYEIINIRSNKQKEKSSNKVDIQNFNGQYVYEQESNLSYPNMNSPIDICIESDSQENDYTNFGESISSIDTPNSHLQNNLIATVSASKTGANCHKGHRKRMNERVLLDPEFENFAPHEMLEFLLYIGVPMKDTNEIAHALIEEFGSFSKVFYASIEDLVRVNGMTERAAYTIASVLPIARWVSIQNSSRQRVQIKETHGAITFLRPYFENKLVENIYLVCLDGADYVINVFPISKGGGNLAVLDSRQIINKANSSMASKAILAHNHPSGTLMPSLDDVTATARVAVALNAIFVNLADHLIFVPNGNAYSFYASGILYDILTGSDQIIGSDTVSEVYSLINPAELLKLKKPRSSAFLKDIHETALKKGMATDEDMNKEYE